MDFIDRHDELRRLNALEAPGLAVLWGRRRVGKTRLLVEWSKHRHGLYTVADQSTEAIQRRYFAEAVGERIPGFAEAEYPDWRSLLRALSREATRGAFRGPLVIDEVPYLMASAPSLPSVLQNWIDHECKQAGLLVVLAGSSQRMMQGLVLNATAPLYGRAKEAILLKPLSVGWTEDGLGLTRAVDCVRAYTVWGGIPWYWELAAAFGPNLERAVDSLVLDPMGPLHSETDRLLLEEQPTANALRPLLDAIGGGAHRLSEIAGRIGQPATSLSRPLTRLMELGLVRREHPFGANEQSGKRVLYQIADPFFRSWFRVVAPHRGFLAVAPKRSRMALWRRQATRLTAETWEDLAREAVPRLSEDLLKGGPFAPAARYWRGLDHEWDIVASGLDGRSLLLGEAKWREDDVDEAFLQQTFHELTRKGAPDVPEALKRSLVYAVFVPSCPKELKRKKRPFAVIDAEDVLAAAR